jgi:hypothetical protein
MSADRLASANYDGRIMPRKPEKSTTRLLLDRLGRGRRREAHNDATVRNPRSEVVRTLSEAARTHSFVGAPTDVVLWLAAPDAAMAFRADALDAADLLRYERIRRERRRRDFVVSRALLQGLRGESSAPLPLSHSGGYACAAQIKADAASRLAFGLDLEAHQPRDELTLARFAFNADEVEGIENRRAAERARCFYALWTLKEAVAKALGLPLLDALRECVFAPHAGGWRVRIPTDAPYTLTVLEPRPALTLAIALIGRSAPLNVAMQEWPSAAGARWPVVAQITRGEVPSPPGYAGVTAPVRRATAP